jgi:hypothetical protein
MKRTWMIRGVHTRVLHRWYSVNLTRMSGMSLSFGWLHPSVGVGLFSNRSIHSKFLKQEHSCQTTLTGAFTPKFSNRSVHIRRYQNCYSSLQGYSGAFMTKFSNRSVHIRSCRNSYWRIQLNSVIDHLLARKPVDEEDEKDMDDGSTIHCFCSMEAPSWAGAFLISYQH